MTAPARADDEAAVRALIEAWAAAVRGRNIGGVLRRHAADVLMFDVPPPFRVEGLEAYSRTWERFFAWSRDPVAFHLADLTVSAGGDVAFATAAVRCAGTETSGEPVELDVRLTIGLRRIDGRWTVVHEHHSVPATS